MFWTFLPISTPTVGRTIIVSQPMTSILWWATLPHPCSLRPSHRLRGLLNICILFHSLGIKITLHHDAPSFQDLPSAFLTSILATTPSTHVPTREKSLKFLGCSLLSPALHTHCPSPGKSCLPAICFWSSRLSLNIPLKEPSLFLQSPIHPVSFNKLGYLCDPITSCKS